MKLFTKAMAMAAMVVLPLVSAFAANITIVVGDNYYRAPGVTTGNSDIRDIRVGDIVTFSYATGQSTHPTASDNGAFATFPMNASSRTFTFPATFFTTVGAVYPYHCTAHGAPGSGQYGVITVRAATPTATLDANATGISVSVYPNPSHGQVTVQLNQKAGQSYLLRLSNIIGQEVRTIALKPELTSAGLPLDLSDLRTGVYFYSLLVDGRVVSTKRLVLQN